MLDYLRENPCVIMLIAIAVYILFVNNNYLTEPFALHQPYDYRANPEKTQSGKVKFDWLYNDQY